MPETSETPAKKAPKKGWFRRLLRWVGLLLLIVVIFHRPLFHFTVRTVLRLVAARMHVNLDLHTSGTIFTNLTISGIKVSAEPGGTTPIKTIDIGEVRLDYSIPLLIKHGVGEFLRSYEIHNANLELLALPSKTPDEKHEKVEIAKTLDSILGQPAAYADRVWIENFSITVTAQNNVTEVKNVHLLLEPDKVGYFRISHMAIPGLPVWDNLNAETSYAQRNFFIKNLRIAPELVLDEINFDASQRAQNKGSVTLMAHAFGGTASLSLSGSQLNKKGENLDNAYDTTLKIEVADIALDQATAYFKAPKPPVGKLDRLSILFTGEPEKPKTWKGNIDAKVGAIAAGTITIDSAGLSARFLDGHADIDPVEVIAGANRIGLAAKIELPESVNDFPKSDIDATLKIDATDLKPFTATMPDPLQGTVSGGGTLTLKSGQLHTELAIEAAKIGNKDLELPTGKITIQATKQINPAPPGPFDLLDANVTAELSALRFQTFTLDSLKLGVEARNRFIKLQTLEVKRGENYISADGGARIPEDPSQIAKTPVNTQFTIHIPRLGDFGVAAGGQTLTGQIEGAGTMQSTNGALAGGVKIDGSNLTLGGFVAQRLAAKVDVANNEAVIDQLAVQINGTDQIVATGKAGLAAPFPYEGGLIIDIKNLSSLQPLLEVFGVKDALSGTFGLQWNGKGQAQPQAHNGQLDLALTKAKFGALDLKEVTFGGMYAPEFAESKPFHVVIGTMSLEGGIEYREARLRLKDLKFEQAGTPVLTGYIYIPFDPSNSKQPIAFDQRIAANINTDKLDVEKLMASFGQVAPLAGTISANVVAGGTLLQPFAHVKVTGERLQAKAAKQFEPAALALDLHYSNKELTLASTLKQPQIQPLEIKAHLPLDLQATVENKKLDPDLPLEATATLPASSLAFLPKIVPQVRRIEGTVGLNVHVGGTVSKPEFSGGTALELKDARMVDENIPSIGAFHAKLAFAGNKLDFQTFEGEVGGGKFKLGGGINLTDMKNPVFGLHLESDEVLVKRDDSVTVRADTDIKLDGPLNAAAVTGALYIVHSRFFREIDILPIALPGKPKPAPKTASTGPTVISIPAPPLRDWKFDLAIKTREKDPFLIRGNLANGAVSLDLKLGGTGLAPYLEGSAKIDQFVATLPFSSLSITSGFVAFTKDLPFQPSMEFQAESQVRDYLVHAYIYGKATDPQVQLSSEPPLPHADIVSLLATGTTVSELAGNADALASRAALIAVKQLYQKIFKKGAAPPPDEKKPGGGSIQDRFEVELGALGNHAGAGQEVKTRFKITDQVYLLGDIGVDGNFTGSLKYLIRFR